MAGGAEQQLVELLSNLDRNRFQPHVVCLYGTRAGYSLHYLEDIKRLGIPVINFDLRMRALDKLWGVLRLIRLYWRIRPAIVQTNNYHSNFLARFARLAAPRLKLISGLYVEYTDKQWRYERLSSWLVDAVVCNSRHLEELLREQLRNREVVLIPNGIDLLRFGDSPPLPRIYPDEGENSVTLLMMGRIVQQKAPQLLVEAIRILKSQGQLSERLQVRIVGEVQDTRLNELLNTKIKEYELSPYFVQLPATRIPEAELYAADVVVLTSLWEGLSGVMLEALAVGCPVLTSDAANRAGVIVHGVNGWIFRTEDPEDLAKYLLMICSMSRTELTHMHTVCRQSAAPFTVKRMVERYETLYERLTARV